MSEQDWSDVERDVIAAFTALDHLRSVEGDPTPGPRPVLFADLVAYVRGHDTPGWQGAEAALRQDDRLRRQFEAILARTRRAHIPTLVAAMDDGPIQERRGDRFSIKMRASKAQVDQSYVLLTVEPAVGMADGVRPVLLVAGPRGLRRLSFPPLQSGQAQLIYPSDSPVLAELRDADATLSLI